MLTLNDEPLGTKHLSDTVQGALTWDVPFKPGTLKAVGARNSAAVCEFVLKTAGPASKIALLPDVKELRADGRDVCHVEFQIVDAQGVRVPDATSEVTFAVTGPAQLLGIETGDLNSPSNGKGPSRNAVRGRGLAFLQSKPSAGLITITASAPGLAAMSVVLNSK
jgi:beta-galactosidase